MTPRDIQALVGAELAQWAPPDLDDLRECFVEPKLIECLDPIRDGRVEAWLVFAEIPGGQGGYGVIYDEHSKEFGLLEFRPDMLPVVVGLHGSLGNAVDAM